MSIRCKILVASVGLCVLPLAAARPTEACTGITLLAKDGSAVYGRTLEWGSFDLESRLIVIPRGKEFTASTPDGKPGLRWRRKYGVAGIDVLEKDALADAMNEKGLVAGLFYHPGFASYTPYDPSRAARSMGPTDVMSYLLASFATLDEVREGMRSATIWTSAWDLRNKDLYYHTQHNRRVRRFDLGQIDWDELKSEIVHLALDREKSQDIEQVSMPSNPSHSAFSSASTARGSR